MHPTVSWAEPRRSKRTRRSRGDGSDGSDSATSDEDDGEGYDSAEDSLAALTRVVGSNVRQPVPRHLRRSSRPLGQSARCLPALPRGDQANAPSMPDVLRARA